MAFWALRNIDTRDALNEAMWAESPDVQATIQPYRDDWRVGEIGAQQAMRAPRRLPWVPDLVGVNWRSERKLLSSSVQLTAHSSRTPTATMK